MVWGCVLDLSSKQCGYHRGVSVVAGQGLHTSKPFRLLTPLHQGGLAYTRSWEETQLGQLLLTGQRDIADHMKLCEKEGKGRHLVWWPLSSQVIVTHDGALLSWRTGLDAPSPGETENEFLILLCLCTWLLLSPLHCLYLKPPNYFIIYSCNSLSHYTWVELVSGSVGLICQLGLNHKSYLLYQYWRQIKLKNIVVFISHKIICYLVLHLIFRYLCSNTHTAFSASPSVWIFCPYSKSSHHPLRPAVKN